MRLDETQNKRQLLVKGQTSVSSHYSFNQVYKR